MTNSQSTRNAAVRNVERIEDMDSEHELRGHVDNVDLTVSLEGYVKEITVTIDHGPKVVCNLSSGTVEAFAPWSSEDHKTHVGNEAVRSALFDWYETQFKQLQDEKHGGL